MQYCSLYTLLYRNIGLAQWRRFLGIWFLRGAYKMRRDRRAALALAINIKQIFPPEPARSCIATKSRCDDRLHDRTPGRPRPPPRPFPSRPGRLKTHRLPRDLRPRGLPNRPLRPRRLQSHSRRLFPQWPSHIHLHSPNGPRHALGILVLLGRYEAQRASGHRRHLYEQHKRGSEDSCEGRYRGGWDVGWRITDRGQ
ncbi:hypothetical protein BU26DRAFT_23815 [Trematosphaeria pertusa]|uniref:Uncharacterized protein n=1 Tax=Trematosphaeria pertusa TaxID=390896 RepID=A0A6A6J105_9PLEO|nr:uncharacterized protein BU26DRAFT_23815 [Trematosphaeria pertusa]KAF2256525.1 hypothetical protein BU26DRAFT_23815 [Trematosphaeria pertusa]